ncbi:MAG: DnaJ domain-containing protein [Bryobacteraceae bacterium]
MPTQQERRKKSRKTKSSIELQIRYRLRTGDTSIIPSRLVDLHENGCGLEVATPLETGAQVLVFGDMLSRGRGMEIQVPGRVAWCRMRSAGVYRAGIEFVEPLIPQVGTTRRAKAKNVDGTDYYEVLQLSESADPDMVVRAYRILGQRYHPKNADTGNAAQFRLVEEAFKVLGDEQRRAAYDSKRSTLGGARNAILDLVRAVNDLDLERAREQAILLMLVNKRRKSPRSPLLAINDFEEALECSRDDLEFAIWYMRENNLMIRTDDGRFAITPRGVDHVESYARREVAEMREERAPQG